jgi:HEAT repeat protein
MSAQKKIHFVMVVLGMLVTGTALVYFSIKAKSRPAARSSPAPVVSLSSDICLAEGDIAENIKKLSRETSEVTDAAKRLLSVARTSTTCREKTIQRLVFAMDKPHLDLRDQPTFYLWSNGASLLGSLKAVEALDFLIDHSNLNDGLFSASMYHQPAVGGIIAMGSAAVPKLSDALRHNKNREIRLTVALCLASIGGQEATEALKQALLTESEECVRRFIELSFAEPTADVLRQRLLAFRCGN